MFLWVDKWVEIDWFKFTASISMSYVLLGLKGWVGENLCRAEGTKNKIKLKIKLEINMKKK